MSTGTLTCTVGCNSVQINKRGDDCFGAPNTITPESSAGTATMSTLKRRMLLRFLNLWGF